MLRKVINKDGVEIHVCSLKQIKAENAPYNIIMSGRSDGKSFAVLEEILQNKLKKNKQGAIIRRWDLDFKRGRGAKMWANLVSEGKLVGTGWDDIIFRGSQWFLAKWDEDTGTYEYDNSPLCHALAMSDVEHTKSTSYPEVTTILFDEFIPMNGYFPDEFVVFINLLSTVIRKYRKDVTIYLCANTITTDSPYFREFGLTHIKNQKPGTIEVYKQGEHGCKIAVEILPQVPNRDKTNSDYYFAFDNPKLAMVRGDGFEIAMYPHLPTGEHIRPRDIKRRFYVYYNDELIEGNVVRHDNVDYLYFHIKTTALSDEDSDRVYTEDPDIRRNWYVNILTPGDKFGTSIFKYFKYQKVFYQDNEVGNSINNYIKWCLQNRLTR
jgi:hypothetical protein